MYQQLLAHPPIVSAPMDSPQQRRYSTSPFGDYSFQQQLTADGSDASFTSHESSPLNNDYYYFNGSTASAAAGVATTGLYTTAAGTGLPMQYFYQQRQNGQIQDFENKFDPYHQQFTTTNSAAHWPTTYYNNQQQLYENFMMFDPLHTATTGLSAQKKTPILSSTSAASTLSPSPQQHFNLQDYNNTYYYSSESSASTSSSANTSPSMMGTDYNNMQHQDLLFDNVWLQSTTTTHVDPVASSVSPLLNQNDKEDTNSNLTNTNKSSQRKAGGGKKKSLLARNTKRESKASTKALKRRTPAQPCKQNQEKEQELKQFPCSYEGCGKIFKRSEHLKRHIKSIHTKEKPYTCPYDNCDKRFSRTDNLSQHIRIHRPSKEHHLALARRKSPSGMKRKASSSASSSSSSNQ